MIKKLTLILFGIMGILILFSSDVFGYELKFKTDYDSDKDVYYFYTHVKSSQHSREYFKAYKKSDGTSPQYNKDFIPVDISDTVNGVYYGSYGNRWGSYDIMGIMFHSEPLSNYDSSTYNSPIEYFYAYPDSAGKPMPGTESIKYSSWSTEFNYNVANADQGEVYKDNPGQSGTKYKITSKSSNDFQRYAIGTQEFPYPEYTLSDSSNASTVIYRYAVPAEVFKRAEVEKYRKVDENGNTYIYISFETKYAGTSQNMQKAGDFYEKVFGNSSNNTDRAVKFRDWIKTKAVIEAYTKRKEYMQEHREEIEGQSGDRYTQEYNWLTTHIEIEQGRIDSIQNQYHFVQDTESSDVFGPFVKGVNYSNGYALGYSAANDYDNRLYISNESELYIQYMLFDKNATKSTDGYPIQINKDISNTDVTEVLDISANKKVNKEELTSGIPVSKGIFEKFSLDIGNSYNVKDVKKEIIYKGKKYILVQALSEYESFSKNRIEEINKFAYSSYIVSNKSTFLQLYEKLGQNKLPKEEIQYNNVLNNSIAIVRWVYIEVPTDLYVQYELMTLDNGEYRKDLVNLFLDRIEIKNGNTIVRELVSKENLAKDLVKVEPVNSNDDSKVEGEAVESIYLDPSKQDVVKEYTEQIKDKVYQHFNLSFDKSYRISSSYSFTARAENGGTVNFYLAEYLSEHLDEIVTDEELKERIKKKIYDITNYPGNEISGKNCSRMSPRLASFKEAYKTLEKVGQDGFSSSIFNENSNDKSLLYIRKINADKDPKWYDFVEGPYKSANEQVLRLVYIEVPTTDVNLYVQYQLMTYDKESKTMVKDNVDLFKNEVYTPNSKKTFLLGSEDGIAKNIVKIEPLIARKALDYNQEDFDVIEVDSTAKIIEPEYLDNRNLYKSQIEKKVYERFSLSYDYPFYRASAANGFKATLDDGTSVMFYLIEYLAENMELIEQQAAADMLKKYLNTSYSNFNYSRFSYDMSFIKAYNRLDSSGNRIRQLKNTSNYAYTISLTKDTVVPNSITTDAITGTINKKIPGNHVVRLVYIEVPNIGESIDTIELKGLDIVGKLQFIGLNNINKTSIMDIQKQKGDNYNVESFKRDSSYKFFNSTYKEQNSEDYIPTDEYITPYATNAYSYIIRALGWKVHDDTKEFLYTINTKRSYEYIYRWDTDNAKLPNNKKHLLDGDRYGYINYVEKNADLFFYTLNKDSKETSSGRLNNTQILDKKGIGAIFDIVNSNIEEVSTVVNTYTGENTFSRKMNDLLILYKQYYTISSDDVNEFKSNILKQCIYNYIYTGSIASLPAEGSGERLATFNNVEYPTRIKTDEHGNYVYKKDEAYYEWLEHHNEFGYHDNYIPQYEYLTVLSNRWNAYAKYRYTETYPTDMTGAGDYEDLNRLDNVDVYDTVTYDSSLWTNSDYVAHVGKNGNLTIAGLLDTDNYFNSTITRFIRNALRELAEPEDIGYEFEKDEDYFIKYWNYDLEKCPYAETEKTAYGDHEHNLGCCRGYKIDKDNEASYKYDTNFTCTALYSYEFSASAYRLVWVPRPAGETTIQGYTRNENGEWGKYTHESVPASEGGSFSRPKQTSSTFETYDLFMEKHSKDADAYTKWASGFSGPGYGIDNNSKEEKCGERIYMTNKGNHNDDMLLESKYYTSETVYHSDQEVKSGKCALWEGRYDELTSSFGFVSNSTKINGENVLPYSYLQSGVIGSSEERDQFGRITGYYYAMDRCHAIPGTVIQTEDKICRHCKKEYSKVVLNCTYTDITGLLANETSNINDHNVDYCKQGYPYFKTASCSSPFEDCETHKYKGKIHINNASRVYQGHIHDKNCYITSYLEDFSVAINDSKPLDKLLKETTIEEAKDYNYANWISTTGKQKSDLVYFSEIGYQRIEKDKNGQWQEYNFKYDDPKVTGIDCSDTVVKGTKTSSKSYFGELSAKYYTINNFHLYKVASLTLHDNNEDRTYEQDKVKGSLSGNPTFKFTDNLEKPNDTTIIPSDEYNELFTDSDNTLHSPLRKVSSPIYLGKGDEPGSTTPVINYDMYADNIEIYYKNIGKDFSKFVDFPHAAEWFLSDRKNYYIKKSPYYNNEDYEEYNLGYSLSMRKENLDTISNSYLIKEVELSKGNMNKYSFGNYGIDLIYLKLPVTYGNEVFNKYIETSKSVLSRFLDEGNGKYYIELEDDIYSKVFRLYEDGKETKNYSQSEYNSLNTTLKNYSTGSFVSTPGVYTGAGGKSGNFTDSFKDYRTEKYDSENIFLADADLKYNNYYVGKKFEKKVQDSVEALTNTEAMLRVGISFEVKDYFNDYFTFTKQYGETLYGDPNKEGYTAGELDHHTNYKNDDSLLNRNKSWGWIKYTYNFADGMRVFVAHSEEEYNKLNYYSYAKELDSDGKPKKDEYGKAEYENTIYTKDELIKNHVFEDYVEYNVQGRSTIDTSFISECRKQGVSSDKTYILDMQGFVGDRSRKVLAQLNTILGYEKYYKNGYVNKLCELNKLFDLTDFVNVGSELITGDIKNLGISIKYANGNSINNVNELNPLGETLTYTYKGLGGTYFKNDDPTFNENKNEDRGEYQSSAYTYTKNYEKFTDTTANKKIIDIYDWSLSSFKTIAALVKDTKTQKQGDGTGNGLRDFTFDVTYKLVENNGNNELYRFDNDKEEKLDDSGKRVSDYTNYTEYGKVKRVKANSVYMYEGNFIGDKNYQNTITNDFVFSTTDNSSTGNRLNILNPIKLKEVSIIPLNKVNQEVGTRSDSQVLGKNTEFMIKFETDFSDAAIGYGNIDSQNKVTGVDTKKYIKEYWIINDFDVICKNCADHPNSSGFHRAGSIIRIKANQESGQEFRATTTSSYGDTAVGIGKNNTEVFAISSNMPGINIEGEIVSSKDGSKLLAKYLIEKIESGELKYMQEKEILYTGRKTGTMNEVDDGRNPLYQYTLNDAYHLAYDSFETESTYRIFSFEITDFTDLSYKNIFRNGIKATNNYFAGKYQWDYNILDGEQIKELDSYLGTSNARVNRKQNKEYGGGYILPVGPNSIKDTGYIYGPKLGYTFSFDFKTTGYFDATKETKISNRYVTIIPSYYYLSKDGEFIDNVDLYYKNSNGKYIRFVDSGYKIAFKPNDGYRNLRFIDERDYHEGSLSTDLKYVDISNSKGFTLNSSEFMTTSFDNFMQTWYGEFKLPNSTIVVAKDDKGSSNPNNALTGGYIGVCFEIKCTDKNYAGKNNDSLVVSYNVNDRGNITEKVDEENPDRNFSNNTSQWDYDGIFGVNSVGSSGNITITGILPNNKVWKVSNKDWQKVKSTVVLYETDLRADDDFN